MQTQAPVSETHSGVAPSQAGTQVPFAMHAPLTQSVPAAHEPAVQRQVLVDGLQCGVSPEHSGVHTAPASESAPGLEPQPSAVKPTAVVARTIRRFVRMTGSSLFGRGIVPRETRREAWARTPRLDLLLGAAFAPGGPPADELGRPRSDLLAGRLR